MHESVDYAENTDQGFFLEAGDDERDAITGYAVTGGADAALFEIHHEDGYSVVAFATPPDYEHPSDDDADNDYELEVTATGGLGERALSVTRTVTVTVTDDDEAPHPPVGPAVASVTETSVTLTWDEPHNTGPAIDDYDVHYRAAGDTAWIDWPHTGTATTATITGLSGGTAYELQVRAGNDEGTSGWSLNPTASPGEGASVTTGRSPWTTSGYFQAEVYDALLRELGYAVSDPVDLEQGYRSAYAVMAGGAMDFWADSWYPAHERWLDDVLDDGSRVGDHVSAIGYQMIAGGLQGIVITKSFADDYGVYTLEDLDSNADAIAAYDAVDEVPGNGKADIYGCPQASICGDTIDEQFRFGGYQNIQQVTGDYDEMHANALARVEAGQPAAAYVRTPSTYIAQLRPGDNVYWLGTEAILPSRQPGTVAVGGDQCPAAYDHAEGLCPLGSNAHDIRVTANNDFLAENPAARALFEAVWLRMLDVSLAYRAQDFDGAGPADLAAAWIDDHRDLVDEWLAYSQVGFTTAVTGGNVAPEITSTGLEVTENTHGGLVLTAVDDDPVDSVTGYAITGGSDRAHFEIDGAGGLALTGAPDFERPADTGRDNAYEVEVTVTSGAGPRSQTAAQTITFTVVDDDTEAPSAPSGPTASPAATAGLSLSWAPPANAGPPITDYDVQYRAGGDTAWTDWPHTGAATTATITGLSGGTTYELQVRATNPEGTSGWSRIPVLFSSVSAGRAHSCGITTDSTVACWGTARSGQATPPTGTFTAVSAGSYHSCGVRTDSTVACWGNNGSGQATPPTGTFTSMSAGYAHSCGIKADRTVACWGADWGGQVTGAPSGSFTAVSAGYAHSCGVRTDRTVACWGNNRNGQATPPTGSFTSVSAGTWHSCGLRTGGAAECWGLVSPQSLTPSGSFVSVSAGDGASCGVSTRRAVVCWGGQDTLEQSTPASGSFASVSVGELHACATRTDGTVECWGYYGDRQTSAPAGAFTSASAGDKHSCGVGTGGTVACWGENRYGQASPPSGPFTAVSAGNRHSCGIKTDSTVACWGADWDGPVTGTPSGSFTAVSAGREHSCGVKADSTVACWGADWDGQVTGTPSGSFTAVSAGNAHSCGLRTDGTIACWGADWDGQATPSSGSFTAVSAGNAHSCGLRTGGTIACWGNNYYGQVTPPTGPFTAVSVGDDHSCGLTTGGTIECWGSDEWMQTAAPSGSFTSISAGATHSCGVSTSGALRCWGADGQERETPPALIATATTSSNAAPRFTGAAASGAFGVVENAQYGILLTAVDDDPADSVTGYEITGGADRALFEIRATIDEFGNRGLFAVAARDFERPTDSGRDNTYTVVVTVTSGEGPRRLTASQSMTFTVTDDDTEAPSAPEGPAVTAITSSSLALAWDPPHNAGPEITGYGVQYRATGTTAWTDWPHSGTARTATITGLAADTDYELQVLATNPEGTSDASRRPILVTSVSAGKSHSCAVRADFSVDCWGNDDNGQLSPPPGLFASVSAGWEHSCGLTTGGEVRCWGYDYDGRVTDAPSGSFVSVSAGGEHSCGLTTGGEVRCWGADELGQVTDAPSGSFVSVSAGGYHSCGLTTGGEVRCWGHDNAGGVTDAPSGSFVSVSAGGGHSCALGAGGTAVCWGADENGQVSGAPSDSFTAITASRWNTCGLTTRGEVRCWGWIGVPAAGAPSGSFTAVSAGSGFWCGVRADSAAVCWGWFWDDDGQWSVPTVIATATTAASGNAAPSFTSSDRFQTAENSAAVGFATAVDDDAQDQVAGYTIVGGADHLLFSLTTAGELSFNTAPDFERPADTDTDGDYELQVSATSGTGTRAMTSTQTITVSVTDVTGEAPSPPAPTVDQVTDTIATISWPEPPNTGPAITDYDVQYRAAGDTAWTTWPHSGTATTATITGLTASTAYELQTRATNPEGTSSWYSSPLQFTAITAGGGHTCALKTDRTATCWGEDNYGQSTAPAGTFTAIAAARDHTCALNTDSTATCWGNNSIGQATAPAGTYIAITAGAYHTCAIKTGGTATCWGWNEYGRATAPAGTFTAITAGPYHTCAIKAGGTATCWGWNVYGQSTAPAGTFTAIAVGIHHTCAINTGGTATCWGHNGYGQSTAPAGTFTAIAAGDYHTCALKADGTATCWGWNVYGQLTAPAGTFTAITAGSWYTCALKTDTTATCWGANGYGQATVPAFNTTSPNAGPRFTSGASLSVLEGVGVLAPVAAVDDDSEDAVTGYTISGGADRALFAIDDAGALSFTTDTDYERPADTGADNTYEVTVTATSGQGTRQRTASHTITVTVTDDDTEAPSPPAGPTVHATATSLQLTWDEPPNTGPPITDYDIRYRATGTGAWTTWPHTGTARTTTITGLTTNTTYELRVRATNPEGTSRWSSTPTFTAITAGEYHTCALKTDRTATCWGRNNYEQATAPAGTFTAITAGRNHTCALKTDGTATCWGEDSFGQATAPAGTFIAITAGGYHTCALNTDRTATCWGYNGDGQATAPAGTFIAITAGSLPHMRPQNRPHRHLLGRQRRRAGHRTRRNLHCHHRRPVPHMRPQNRPHRHLLGLQLGRAGHRTRRNLHRHHRRQRPHMRPQNRPHRHLLGQQRRRAGHRTRRNLHRHHRRPVPHMRPQNRPHRHLLGQQQLRADDSAEGCDHDGHAECCWAAVHERCVVQCARGGGRARAGGRGRRRHRGRRDRLHDHRRRRPVAVRRRRRRRAVLHHRHRL